MTAISETTYHKLDKILLQKSSRSLQGPAGQLLTVLGQFMRRVSYAKRSSNEVIFVVCGLKNNLLGLPAIHNLHLVKKVDSTISTTTAIQERFPTVFEGLGTLGEEYRIQLKDDAVPYALYTSQNVPLPLWDKTGAGAKGVHGHDLQGGHTHSLVRRHGGGAEEVGGGENLCGLKTIE